MRDTTREANHSIYDLTYSAIVDLLRLSQKESNWCKIGPAPSKGGGYFSKALIRLAGFPHYGRIIKNLSKHNRT